jgi:hypothetical protein
LFQRAIAESGGWMGMGMGTMRTAAWRLHHKGTKIREGHDPLLKRIRDLRGFVTS